MRFGLPNFRGAHKPIAEAAGYTMGLQRAIAVVLGNGIHIGGVTADDCVALFDFGYTPSIVDAASK